jgi:serine/threonine protein kinase
VSDAADDALARLLLERGLLTPEEHEEALRGRKETGKPLADVLVARSLLTAPQVKDALAALQKQVRFCPECKAPVYVTRVMAEGDRCPRCLGPVEWQSEQAVAQIQDLENLVQLTKDELPREVQRARAVAGRLFGKYVLLEELGKGGAGVVQKAWDTMLGEYVALKFIRELRQEPESKAEVRKLKQEQILDLLQEARAALRLRPEHIVAVRDLGRIDQQFYIAMDYVEGRTLAEHIRAAQARGKVSPLYEDPVLFLTAVRDVATAIHYAHTFPKPIVHCDLKPGNVLLGRTGCAYVMDFGLARVLGGRRDEESEEKVRGTPSYMAPEQLSGRSDQIGPRTDVYAIGAVLYELMAGRPVFVGEPLSILLQATRGTVERPTDVVRKQHESGGSDSTKILLKLSRLEEICLKCLSKEPGDRYQTARHVAEDLAAVLEAIAAGKDRDMVPPRVLEAQERSELAKVDDHITHLDLARALEETETLEKKRDTTRLRDRLDRRRRQVQLLEDLRTRLVERLNARRPSFQDFETSEGVWRDVEVLKATPSKIYLLAGDTPRDLTWAQIPCTQVVAMAEAAGVSEPVDRLALGSLCHHAHASSLALRFLTSLGGTPFEEEARRLLQATS